MNASYTISTISPFGVVLSLWVAEVFEEEVFEGLMQRKSTGGELIDLGLYLLVFSGKQIGPNQHSRSASCPKRDIP